MEGASRRVQQIMGMFGSWWLLDTGEAGSRQQCQVYWVAGNTVPLWPPDPESKRAKEALELRTSRGNTVKNETEQNQRNRGSEPEASDLKKSVLSGVCFA